MKEKLNRENYQELTNKIKNSEIYKNILNSDEIYLEFIVGDKSKVTLKDIIALYNILNIDKSKKINSSFMVDKLSVLEETEFEFLFYNSQNKEIYEQKLKKISLNEVLK